MSTPRIRTPITGPAPFFIDWGVNWAPFPSASNLFFGVGGYYITLFTDDGIKGVKVAPDGFLLKRIAVGSQLVYNFSQKAGIAAKYQREFETENRPEGDRFWLQFVFPIGKSG
jgi:hypothetical protein